MKIRHLIEVTGTPTELAPLLDALPVDPRQVQETCRQIAEAFNGASWRRLCREEGWPC